MKDIISCEQMREADRHAIEDLGIPSIALMENAAMSVFNEIKDMATSFVIVASCGNNGGDGLAIARHLMLYEKEVKIYIASNIEKMSCDCKINYEILKNLNADIELINSVTDLDSFKDFIDNQFVVEALFGTGLSRKIEGNFARIIDIINSFSRYIVAVDIPSGIDANTGEVLGCAIEADLTITFHKNKLGIVNAGNKYCGVVLTKYIGIPDSDKY